ncbi:MAG: hypothetical protein KAJ95_03110 [Gammaproteobacteria bacterium]|nr:hypothetical protein [Gammaproteobacteria bacterium]
MSDQSRRKLLKSLAAGSGAIVAGKSLPESWSRPVVDSVMLPAHAQTSPQASFFGLDLQQALLTTDETIYASVGSAFIDSAHAGPEVKPMGSGCATVYIDGVDVTYQNRADSIRRQGFLPLPGKGAGTIKYLSSTSDQEMCPSEDIPCPDLTAEIVVITDDYLDVRVEKCQEGSFTVRIPVGDGCNLPTLDGYCFE